MKTFPIWLNYDQSQLIGSLSVDDNVSEEMLHACGIVPASIRKHVGEEYKVFGFGLVDRTTVDTEPWKL